MSKIISKIAKTKRNFWIEEIRKLCGNFTDDFTQLEKELNKEIKKDGIPALVDHLRLCGSIPESYKHDSRVEKLYSKYTDLLLSIAFREIGLKSFVLSERADSADVEVFSNNYSFVADAKSFRLSRTAKNQKDFKIEALDGWKKGKPYAMMVCPIYQLPNTSSQIYQQAITRNVCIFSYSHLSLLLNYSRVESILKAKQLLYRILQTVGTIQHHNKNALFYWLIINKTMLEFSNKIEKLWYEEKVATSEAIQFAKEESLTFLAKEREIIYKMSHQDAVRELLKARKIDSRIETVNKVDDNGLFEVR